MTTRIMENETIKTTFLSLNYDIINYILLFIQSIDSYMLLLTNSYFKHKIVHDMHILTEYHAIESKNYEHIELVQRTRNKKINVTKYFQQIIETDDLNTISYIIPTPSKYANLINKNDNEIIKNSNKELIYYLFQGQFSKSQQEYILNNERLDLIEYCMNKGVKLFDRTKTRVTISRIPNSKILMHLYSLGYYVHEEHIGKVIESNDIDVFKYILSVVNHWTIDKYLIKYEFPTNLCIGKDIAFFLKDIGYPKFLEIYFSRPTICSQDKVRTENLPECNLLLDASRNIFEQTVPETLYFKKKIEYAYYLIKYRRTELYEHKIFSSLAKDYKYNNMNLFPVKDNIETLYALCKINDPNCIYDFLTIKSHHYSDLFLCKYIDDIIKHNNIIILDILLCKFDCDIRTALIYLRKGMQLLMLHISDKSYIFSSLTEKEYVDICMLADKEAIKNLYNRHQINLSYIVKYCSINTLINIVFDSTFNDNLNTHMHILLCSQLDFLVYYCKNKVIFTKDLYYAFSNCPRAADIVLKSIPDKNRNLIDFISSIKCNTPKFNNKYCKWLIKLDPTVCENDIFAIIDNDSIELFKIWSIKFNIKKIHIVHMINNNSKIIIEYISSIGQLALPFCCYPSNEDPINKSTKDIMEDILEYNCDCVNKMTKWSIKVIPSHVKEIIDQYLFNFDVMKKNYDNGLLQTTFDSEPVCKK